MNEDQYQTAVLKRLDTLISLLLEPLPAGDSTSVSEKVRRLLNLGLGAAEVAEILGKPTNYVTAVIAKRKKRPKTKARSNG